RLLVRRSAERGAGVASHAIRALGAGPPSAELVDGLAVLNWGAVLLATIGGLGSLIALLGCSWIRAYNRISVYIAFLALFAVAVFLERFRNRLRGRPGAKALFAGLLGALLVLGVLDQTSRDCCPYYDVAKHDHINDADFVRAVEASVPPGAMVFQLPYAPFPT